MATMFFGQYLLAKRFIDREALLDALDRQRRSNLSLPELAVREGLIDEATAESVLARYRMSDRSMEEILADVGSLDAGQVQRLQSRQRSSWLRIGAALVEGGHLNEDELATALDAYRALASATDLEVRDALRGVPNAEAVGACVELTMFHIERVSGRPNKLVSVSSERRDPGDGRARFSQRIVGDGDFTIAVDLPPGVASAVATGMLGFVVEAGSEVEADAVCEVINLIGGNACTRIEQLGHILRPEPPIWSGSGTLVAPEGDAVRATVASAESEYDIWVFSAMNGDR